MLLEPTHPDEREGWNAVAGPAVPEAPGDAFAAYCSRRQALAHAPAHLGELRCRRVLVVGCGAGEAAVALARSGAAVSAFDLSPTSVKVTRARLRASGVHGNVSVAAAEDLPYADESFDLVVGESVLHRLDVGAAAAELHRVLKPGGRAAFGEPMGARPGHALALERVPRRGEVEHGAGRRLDHEEIQAWGAPFSAFAYREVQLLGTAERLLRGGARPLRLGRVDDALLARMPALRRWCRSVCLAMTR